MTKAVMRATAAFWAERADHWQRMGEPKLATHAAIMAAGYLLAARLMREGGR